MRSIYRPDLSGPNVSQMYAAGGISAIIDIVIIITMRTPGTSGAFNARAAAYRRIGFHRWEIVIDCMLREIAQSSITMHAQIIGDSIEKLFNWVITVLLLLCRS